MTGCRVPVCLARVAEKLSGKTGARIVEAYVYPLDGGPWEWLLLVDGRVEGYRESLAPLEHVERLIAYSLARRGTEKTGLVALLARRAPCVYLVAWAGWRTGSLEEAERLAAEAVRKLGGLMS